MANWASPEYTKSQVNKAGQIIAGTSADPTQGDLDWAEGVLSNWRLIHAYPINTFNTTLRDKLRLIDKNALVAQRLKRRPSIILKLKRFKEMELSRMQDIGGLRAVVKDIDSLKRLVDDYKVSKFDHALVKENNYVGNPKSSGYRSVHLVYKYKNNRALGYNDLQIELQIRTYIQHAWATAVETMGTYLQHSLKSSEGPDEWLEFFKLAGSAFAHIENQTLVPGYENLSKQQTFERLVEMENKLVVIEKLKAFSNVTEKTHNIGGHYRLITLDTEKKSVTISSYSRSKLDEANNDYAKIEKTISEGANLQVVLVSAKSIKLLKKAYPNYFLDTQEFIKQFEKIKMSVNNLGK